MSITFAPTNTGIRAYKNNQPLIDLTPDDVVRANETLKLVLDPDVFVLIDDGGCLPPPQSLDGRIAIEGHTPHEESQRVRPSSSPPTLLFAREQQAGGVGTHGPSATRLVTDPTRHADTPASVIPPWLPPADDLIPLPGPDLSALDNARTAHAAFATTNNDPDGNPLLVVNVNGGANSSGSQSFSQQGAEENGQGSPPKPNTPLPTPPIPPQNTPQNTGEGK